MTTIKKRKKENLPLTDGRICLTFIKKDWALPISVWLHVSPVLTRDSSASSNYKPMSHSGGYNRPRRGLFSQCGLTVCPQFSVALSAQQKDRTLWRTWTRWASEPSAADSLTAHTAHGPWNIMSKVEKVNETFENKLPWGSRRQMRYQSIFQKSNSFHESFPSAVLWCAVHYC